MASLLSTSFTPRHLLPTTLSHPKPTASSLSLPLKPHFPSCSHHHTNFLTFSSSSSTTTGLLVTFANNSRTFLFFLLTFLLSLSISLSGRRPLPALASPPAPTQETQEPNGERQENDEEVVMYSEMLRRDPGDVDALKCALFAKMRRMEWDGALEHVRRLGEIEPCEVEWRLMEALVRELKGDLAGAEKLFKEILRERPLLVRALHGLALCMHKRHEDTAVFEMLEKALELTVSEDRVPEERNIKLLIAQMHVVKGQLDVASEKLQDLIDKDPRDFRPHLCLGIVYALLDKKKEADEQLEIYRSLVPDEFPEKGFIDDVILAAKMESKDWLKNSESEYLSQQ